MAQLTEIFNQLGLNRENGLYITDEGLWRKQTSFPNRVQRLIERKIKPDAFFCFDNKPLILFFNNPSDKKALHKDIWNFNDSPIAIITDNDSVEIFNGFKFLREAASLEKLGDNTNLSDFKYLELVTGNTWENYKDNLDTIHRVDYKLLDNIKAARTILVARLRGNPDEKNKIASALIGKCIFVRYLIDRKVKMKFDGDKLRIWSNGDFCELLREPERAQQFFDYLEDKDRGFNGDLFPLEAGDYKKISKKDYDVLRGLLSGTDIAKSQPSLFDLYDFSIIPIEFISNVYELFIGKENQSSTGAYYTPLFLVDYILKETVEKHLSGKENDAPGDEKSYAFCKVLDPACGSGIFLVEALRKIIEKYINGAGIGVKTDSFKTAIKNLAKANLYGVDKDESAVQVAIFSIYLTLLDYLDPPGIETFKFPYLLGTNFFVADFFDEASKFNDVLKNIEFDFILGNPPWHRGKGEEQKPLYVRYIEKRRKDEKELNTPVEIGNKEIAQAFLIRSSDFSKVGLTQCALIVTSKVLYNLQSAAFRRYFLERFFVNRVFELAPVRKEVFDKSNDQAIAPACILFFSYTANSNTDKNIIEHISLKPSRFFSLFKIFTINRNDFKKVQQSKLKKYDWLWKVLVYGSYLDFNFIKRLKDDYSTIGEVIEDKEFIIGQGVMVGGGDENDASDLVGKPFIDTRTDIQQYWINPDNNKKWQEAIVHRVRNKELYKSPVLLITEGVRSDFKSKSAICYSDSVYTSSLTGIRGRDNNSIKILRQLIGILNSSFFSYYNLATFSSTGIEREQSHDEEKLKTPFSEGGSVSPIVEGVERLFLKKYDITNALIDHSINKAIDDKINELEESVYELFSVNDEEKSLLNYGNKVIIPLIMRHTGYEKLFQPLKTNDTELGSYASLFVHRFKSRLDSKEKKFVVEIWHTNQVIGMFFKVVSTADFSNEVVWIDKQNNDLEILSFLTTISSEKITDKLFVQKDIRGFEKESFYIFKPNERRLWHKAIGYLDVNEFADAILNEGKARR